MDRNTALELLNTIHLSRYVRTHGKVAEFLGSRRCLTCQTADRPCLISKGCKFCHLCENQGIACELVRKTRLVLPLSAWDWDILMENRSTLAKDKWVQKTDHIDS